MSNDTDNIDLEKILFEHRDRIGNLQIEDLAKLKPIADESEWVLILARTKKKKENVRDFFLGLVHDLKWLLGALAAGAGLYHEVILRFFPNIFGG